jgi:pyruvate formate lyase activating enzyme
MSSQPKFFNNVQTLLTRRQFLNRCFQAGLLLGCGDGLDIFTSNNFIGQAFAQDLRKGFIRARPSPYYISLGQGRVQCSLCPRQCEVAPGGRGDCQVRENRQGVYHTLVYGNPCAVHVDPVEKKPFFHLLPASRSFSIATAGCNLHCKFCQNWEISQSAPEETFNFDLPPERVAALAKENNCATIASTYVEPTIFIEYMIEVGKAGRARGILNTCHSNGYLNPKPLADLIPQLDAACIDLKGFRDGFYQEMADGQLDPVLMTLKTLVRKKVHLEIVNLVIPTKNDQPQMIEEMSRWIVRELGPHIPLHFSRFYPLYRLKNLPPTSVATLEMARSTARKCGLDYVYIGNIPGHEGENTYCSHCQKLLIRRQGYQILENNLKKAKCPKCGKKIAGIWEI